MAPYHDVLHTLSPILLVLNYVQHFINNMQPFTVLPNITNNLAQMAAKRFL